jgi:hypothetical protein
MTTYHMKTGADHSVYIESLSRAMNNVSLYKMIVMVGLDIMVTQ